MDVGQAEHVLIYPNMTYSRGGRWQLESDSFVSVLRSLLPRLAVSQPSLRFTLLSPEPVRSLEPYCEQIQWDLPTYNNTMRCHFNAEHFLRRIDGKRRSWDYVWSHLPEQTLAIKNVIYNSTDERPVFIGYAHWAEIPELVTFSADTFPMWLAGALAMDQLGVTTQAMKYAVMRHACGYLSDDRLTDLNRIVRPVYQGSDAPLYVHSEPVPGRLIWNHRPNAYTGWPLVLAALDQLWTRRQDFHVIATLADVAADRPYMRPSRLPAGDNRAAYFSVLSSGWLGLPRLVNYREWSVSVVDGMAAGLPYVAPCGYVGDFLPPGYPFTYDGGADGADGLTDALDDALTDYAHNRNRASDMSRTAATEMSWDARSGPFAEMFNAARLRHHATSDRSAAYPRVRELAESGMTKQEIKRAMRWGRGIPWTPYRRRLMNDGVSITEERTAA